MIGSGSECAVYDVVPDIVRKDYDSENECTTAYYNAIEAYHAGIGPHVYSRIDQSYYTEKVRVLTDGCRTCLIHCHDTLQCIPDEFRNKVRNIFNTTDLHAWNIGIKNGEFVLIDFGRKSLNRTKGG